MQRGDAAGREQPEVSARRRRARALLVLWVQDRDALGLGDAEATLPRREPADAVLQVVEVWPPQSGTCPARWIVESHRPPDRTLARLDDPGIQFSP